MVRALMHTDSGTDLGEIAGRMGNSGEFQIQRIRMLESVVLLDGISRCFSFFDLLFL